METVVKLDVGGFLLTSVVFGDVDFQMNQRVKIRISSDRNHLFANDEEGMRLASGTVK